MILVIGEILADMIGEKQGGALSFKAFCGGAPFNVAVNAKNTGVEVGFVGRVGRDVIGKFLISEAGKAGLDFLQIQVDEERNTTLAFVSLNDGERSFSFNRHDTADFNIDVNTIDFSQNISIVHLGSLMLSEDNGKKVAEHIAAKTKEIGAKLSFDMNFRLDTYSDFSEAMKAYEPYVRCADIIKFSDDELKLYTGTEDRIEAIKKIYRENQIFLLTMGGEGSMYFYNGKYNVIPTKKVKPIDTTGAGDAFFGTFLGEIENKEWNTENIESAIIKANAAGAATTQFLGAIKI